MAANVMELAQKYKKFVKENPDNVRQFESVVRILSYLIPGRFQDSGVLSELMFSASNLLVLMNDVLLRQAHNIKYRVALPHSQLVGYLTVLDYTEVFLELVAQRLSGTLARWIIVVSIQITKAAIRLLLLLKHKSSVLSSPAIPPLNRDKELKNKKKAKTLSEIPSSNGLILPGGNEQEGMPTSLEGTAVTFTLKRSGRVVRSLAAAPPMMQRTWKTPDHGTEDTIYLPTQLSNKQLWGECLHIARPLLHYLFGKDPEKYDHEIRQLAKMAAGFLHLMKHTHMCVRLMDIGAQLYKFDELSSMYKFGEHSWKPWLLAGSMDVSSLCLIGDPSELNPVERSELRRRLILLLLYMLRSPFYDRFSREKLLTALHLLGSTIPGTNLIIKPILEYLPNWQRIYAYVWAV